VTRKRIEIRYKTIMDPNCRRLHENPTLLQCSTAYQ
jgi:hypothetical protein